jgi:hypothetical protein
MVISWLRAAGIGPGFSAYYFLAAPDRRAALPARLLLKRSVHRMAPKEPLVFAPDNSPT